MTSFHPTLAGSLFWGIVTFSLLVVVHEGGHFLAARLFRVKVHEFMIGLPGPALRWRGRATTFGITAIPLGGYVRIAGMEPGPEDELTGSAYAQLVQADSLDAKALSAAIGVDLDRAEALLATLADYGAAEEPSRDSGSYSVSDGPQAGEAAAAAFDRIRSQTYRGRKRWQRLVILSTGVLFNLLTAYLVFTIVLTGWGYWQATLKIAEVQPKTAAAAAGMKPGDTVLSVGSVRVKTWDGMVAEIAKHKPGQTVAVAVSRGGANTTLRATLGSRAGKAFLGVGPKTRHVRLSVLQALSDSVKWTGMVFVAIGQLLDPKTFATSVQGARSVVGISVEVEKAAKAGALDYAWLVALLSLSLGVMNILPIPPLDGGKIAIEVGEWIVGRPLKRQWYLGFSAVGTLLLLGLIGYLMYADVARIAGGG
jgi:regulator of sigma E protease